MNRDEEVWGWLLDHQGFVRYSDIKKALSYLHDAQLSNSLRRLEEQGLVIRQVILRNKGGPASQYLAVNPSDPTLRVRVVDMGGWEFAILEWLSEDELPRRSTSITLGDITEYIETDARGELVIKRPEWLELLAEKGRATFESRKGMLHSE
jgi:predicted transcriptional regulator